MLLPEVATGGVLWKKVFLEISQYLCENTCTRVSFLYSCSLRHRGFNFVKSLREPFFREHLRGDAFVLHKPRLSFFIEVFEYDCALDQGC